MAPSPDALLAAPLAPPCACGRHPPQELRRRGGPQPLKLYASANRSPLLAGGRRSRTNARPRSPLGAAVAIADRSCLTSRMSTLAQARSTTLTTR